MSLFSELKRRNVFKVAVAYLALAWLLVEVASVLFPAFGIPDWGFRFLVILFALGFVPVVVFSWIYDLTPEGVKRDTGPGNKASPAPATSSKLNRGIVAILAVALAYFAYDKFVLDPQREAALLEEVKREPAVQAAPSREGPPMLAVLPFLTTDLGEDSQFFATGMHDDLLTQLAQLQSIRVISRTSVLEYKDAARNIREIGRALGADAILEGGVQRAGDRIRINAQLIDARTDEHLWAQTYDRELSPSSIFDVQTEIARAITSALQATLSDQETDQLNVPPTENMAAYRAFHRAMDLRDHSDGSHDSHLAIIRALEEAVAHDPSFTRAWAELVGYLSLFEYYDRATGSRQRAEEILERIRAVAPQSGDYLVAQAYYAYYVLRDHDWAIRLVTQAQDMMPSDSRVVELKSLIQRRQGDNEGKAESERLARKLDPRNPRWTRSLVHTLMHDHRYDEARKELDESRFHGYDFEAWRSLLELREHGDFGRWMADQESLYEEYPGEARTADLWDAYVANREFTSAEGILNDLEVLDVPASERGGAISHRQQKEIITLWFTQQSDQLPEAIDRVRADIEAGRNEEGEFRYDTAYIDLALLSAVADETEETLRLIRRWQRESTGDLTERSFEFHNACRVLGIAGVAEEAVECIRDGLEEPSLVMPFLEPFLPYYDSIRDNPVFVDLLTDLP